MSPVGIVMPTHGHNRHLGEAMASVIGQVMKDWRLVLVCDGADAKTEAQAGRLAAADPRIQVVRQPRGGVASARNRGLRELGAEVDLIAFMDHDDRWLPDTLAVLVRAFAARRAERVGVYGNARFIDEGGAPVRPGELEAILRRRCGVKDGRLVDWPPELPTGFANLAYSNCIPVGTALVVRDEIEAIGGFDPRATPADDYDLWLRLARRAPFDFVDQVVLEYRQHPAPTWRRPRGMGRGAPYVRRRAIVSQENSPAQAAEARTGFRICERDIVVHALAELKTSVAAGRPLPVARQLARAVLHAGGYLLGRPGPWHA
jgi:glycosyltransferase involved in cell wall biosynthesis